MDKRFSLWLECGIEAQVPTVKQCITPLVPHVGAVYVGTPFLDGILKPFADWMRETYPWLPFHGGIFASRYFGEAPLTDASGWIRLFDAALTAQRHTSSNIVLVNFETTLKDFNAGRASLDLAAVEAAIRASGIRDSGVDVVFYPTEAMAENFSATYDFSWLLAELFPTARAMTRNYGKPGNAEDPDYHRCEQAMLAAWGPDGLIHRMLVDDPNDPRPGFYAPADVPRAAATIPGEISIWLETGPHEKFEDKPLAAAAVAAAFEAAKGGE